MDLTKKVELYYGHAPVEPGNEPMAECLRREHEFCAVFVQNDVPAEEHERTVDEMGARFGPFTDFNLKQGNPHIRTYIVNCETGRAENPPWHPERDVNAETLRGSGYRTGGIFFNMQIADVVVRALEEYGYEIQKMYD